MINRLCGSKQFRIRTKRKAAVGVAIKTWKIAAGYFNANTVAFLEEIARDP